MPSPRSSRSAGPFTGAPPTIGEIATTGAPLARSASRMPGTARIGPIETTGLLGQSTIALRRAQALDHARARLRAPRGREIDAHDVVRSAVAHQVLLEVDARAAAARHQRGARILRHRQQLRRHAEEAAQLVG